MKRTFLKIFFGFFAAQSAFAGASEIALNYRYKNAQTSQIESGANYFGIDANTNFVSDPIIEKTLLVITMATSLSSWLDRFYAACEPLPGSINEPEEPAYEDCAEKRVVVAQSVLTDVGHFAQAMQNNLSSLSDEQLFEVLDLFRKLAQNMKDHKEEFFAPIYDSWPNFGNVGSPASAMPRAGSSLGVTTGGAQDFAFVRKLINSGYVPSAENFDTKGFLGEFELSPSISCDKLICVEPVYKVDSAHKKLFVQIAMGTNIQQSEFIRKPLNLGLVLDISGSMEANDDTEKSRLEWAKDAAIKTVEELKNQDALSIVVFDTNSEVLLPMTTIGSEQIKAEIIAKIRALQTKGSTNLYAGIKSAYELVSDYAASHDNRENRLILISDAGLNTGVVDEATTLNLVSNYAAEGIGLTAIGLGGEFQSRIYPRY